MDPERLKQLLEAVQGGQVGIEEAMGQLKELPYEKVEEFARLDHHRALRTGYPEVVLGQGKTSEQVIQIMKHLAEKSNQVMVTRVAPEMAAEVTAKVSNAVYYALPRLLIIDRDPERKKKPGVLVCTAGTADLPVAEEAAMTADLMGNEVTRLYDVGVAGIHRLLDRLEIVQKAKVIVVAAGMDGALPSVVGGLAAAPVIAVPTSVGYGASFHGLAALLTMLNSCANGIAVVNIDNGFGAGYMASMINRQTVEE